MKSERRHILLLEVLIALMIVTMCIMPLLAPHIAMVQEERAFQREIELDRLVNLLYGDLLVEKFYRQEQEWWAVLNGSSTEIQDERVKDLGYQGKYVIQRSLKKQKLQDVDDYRYNLLTVKYEFTPLSGGDPLNYTYKLYVKRPGELEKEQKKSEDEDSADEE